MANYCCAIRTNYFHVKDEDKFRSLMDRVYGCEDNVHLWEKKDENGKTVFGFGCYGGIAGIKNALEDENEDVDETAYDEFVDELQRCVAEDDAIIIMESGNEKLRYIIGSAEIITEKDHEYLDISNIAIRKAAEILENCNWATRLYY